MGSFCWQLSHMYESISAHLNEPRKLLLLLRLYAIYRSTSTVRMQLWMSIYIKMRGSYSSSSAQTKTSCRFRGSVHNVSGMSIQSPSTTALILMETDKDYSELIAESKGLHESCWPEVDIPCVRMRRSNKSVLFTAYHERQLGCV